MTEELKIEAKKCLFFDRPKKPTDEKITCSHFLRFEPKLRLWFVSLFKSTTNRHKHENSYTLPLKTMFTTTTTNNKQTNKQGRHSAAATHTSFSRVSATARHSSLRRVSATQGGGQTDFTQACLCDTGRQLDTVHSGVSLRHWVAARLHSGVFLRRRQAATQTSLKRVSATQGGS